MVFEANVQLGDATIAVQDGQVMVYFDGGEGTSVSLEAGVEALSFITRAAKLALAQEATDV